METTNTQITARIRRVRLVKGYSQEYMAFRLGISQQSYSRLESGRQILRISQFASIAEVLELCPEDLMRNEISANPDTNEKDIPRLLSRLEQVLDFLRSEGSAGKA